MRLRRILAFALCACLLLCALAGCGKTSDSESSSSVDYSGSNFTLGNLDITVYGQEIVRDYKGNDCLAINLHVKNRGSNPESVMGTYNVKRDQGTGETLKVAVAYDNAGNMLHTAGDRIDPGETVDQVMCFKLVNKGTVNVTFGNANMGVKETQLSFRVTE